MSKLTDISTQDLIEETHRRKSEIDAQIQLSKFRNGLVVTKDTPSRFDSWYYLSPALDETKEGDARFSKSEAIILVGDVNGWDYRHSAENICAYSKGLFSTKVCGSSGYDHDDRYSVIFVHVPKATEEAIEEAVASIRKYCPEFKATHKFTAVREYGE